MYLKLSNKFKFISELDLLYIFKEKVKCIVVTGSNGKSTLVFFLEDMDNVFTLIRITKMAYCL